MNTEIQEKINELVELLRLHSPPNAVTFALFVNSKAYQAEYQFRTAKNLKARGISMRALSGEWVVDAPSD